MSTTRKLTIGMLTYDDYDGVYFTVQAIRMFHPEVLDEVEFVIADNHPEGAHGKAVERFTRWIKEVPVRYVPLEHRPSTALRDKIFSLANTPYVICMDCHVLIEAGGLKRLIEMFDKGEDGDNLLQGPMVHDNLTGTATHFAQVWRGGMWGIWGSAWRCVCGETFQTRHVRNEKGEEDKQLGFQSLMAPHGMLKACGGCGGEFPAGVEWACHEPKLRALGYVSAADDPRPFEIPAQGMGVFACRKSAWLGFNSRFRGFGGEEGYIHEKFRQAGRNVMCLPFLRWVHRFGRPGGIPYKPVLEDRLFNYLVGHAELGLDPTPVLEHFKDKVPAANLEQVRRESCGATRKTPAAAAVPGPTESQQSRLRPTEGNQMQSASGTLHANTVSASPLCCAVSHHLINS